MSIVFLLVFLLSCTSNVLSTKDDEIILLKMKKQLGNPDILRNWVKGFEYCGIGFNKPPNSLVYIACTSTGRVSSLRIKNLDFSATFPYAICGLTELDSLEIYNWSGLHGLIPPCIHKLHNLRSLVITETSLSGSMPSFSKNINIIRITLSNNHLSGTIPSSLSTLPNLHLLDLSSNYLCGEIPKGGNMGQFNAAVFANNTCLCGNPLPPCFNSAPIYAPAPAPISTTQFDSAPAPAPVSAAQFDSAPALAPVSTAQFDSPPAPAPVSTAQFDSPPAPAPVSTVQFDSAPAPAPVPVSTAQFDSAPAPAPVSTSQFDSPPAPTPAPEMPHDSNSDIYISPRDPNEEMLLLKMNEQLGNPDVLRRWVKGFEYCGIGFSNGQDSFVVLYCTDTGRVTNLRFKDIYASAPFPEAICELTELESIEIYHFPGLYGPIPSCITELINLRSITITETSLSGSVPNFSNKTDLLGLTISSSQLSGTIPQSLSTLPNLGSLDLSSNYLTGTIPPGLVPSNTPMLFLSNNNLTGEIPKSYGSVNFFMIHVGNNKLSGDASFLFGKQKFVVNVDLSNNDFEFNLNSVELSDRLYKLDLSHNKIYGNVPDSFASATRLSYVNLSFNRLCGELPKGGNMEKFNAVDFVNNTCLCGNPLPPCFNSAPIYAPAPVSTTQFDSTPAPAPISTAQFDSPPAPTPAPEMPPDSNSDIYISPRDPNEEILLFKMKEQLGNPDILSRWVKGFEYCGILFSNGQDSVVDLSCTDTGRITNLRFKNLYISAPFPEAICEFTEIETIEIYYFPGLHGPIPSCITELVNLRSIFIRETSLSGSVPNFSNNTNLIGIIISSSQLSGTIPPTLSILPNLQLLDLSSNYLCGEIPQGGNMGQFDATVFANNTCLCGNPLPPCFNSAPAPAPESTTP